MFEHLDTSVIYMHKVNSYICKNTFQFPDYGKIVFTITHLQQILKFMLIALLTAISHRSAWRWGSQSIMISQSQVSVAVMFVSVRWPLSGLLGTRLYIRFGSIGFRLRQIFLRKLAAVGSYEGWVAANMCCRFTHQPHELIHIKGVVGELGMCTQRWVMTL